MKTKPSYVKNFAVTLNTLKNPDNPLNNNLNTKRFYNDLEYKCKTIKKSKSNLRNIKNKLIPEFIYSNRDVPIEWRRKPNYRNNLIQLFATNTSFLSYMGHDSTKTEPNEISPKKNLKTAISSKNITNSSSFISYKEKAASSKNFFKRHNSSQGNYWNKDNKLNDREIKLILDEYKTNFPLYDTNINDKKNLTDNDINEKNLSFKMRLKRKKFFVQSIFNNIIPKIEQYSYRSNKKIIKRNYDNIDLIQEKKDPKTEIKDPDIRKKLENINYYGPYYSYCPSCKIRNFDFYKNLEKKNCINLLDQIKKVKGKIDIDKKLNAKI